MIANTNIFKSSAMYTGYHILKEIQRRKLDKISIYDVAKTLKRVGICNSRQLIMGLIFLYSVDIIDFEEAMICVKK